MEGKGLLLFLNWELGIGFVPVFADTTSQTFIVFYDNLPFKVGIVHPFIHSFTDVYNVSAFVFEYWIFSREQDRQDYFLYWILGQVGGIKILKKSKLKIVSGMY